MKFVNYFNEDFKTSADDLILSTYEFSRHGQISFYDACELISNTEQQFIFDWDILVSEEEFSKFENLFSKLDQQRLQAIRVQDVGVLQYVLDKTNLPIQLVLESGNRNLIGIKKWSQMLGDRLDRLILSPELDKEELKQIRSEINCPLEVLVFGKILLFYSPRKLLSPQFEKGNDEHLKVSGKSEESPHRGFSLIENSHGTFMYNPKDLNLIPYFDEINDIGIDYCRIDNRDFSKETAKYLEKKQFEKLISSHPRPLIKGFFHRNKTDVLFKKLKNQKLLIKDQSYVGNIVDVIKEKQIAINLANKERPLRLGDELILLTPEGKRKEFQIEKLKNLSGDFVAQTTDEQLILIPYPSNLSIKTAVYWKDSFQEQ